MKQHAARILDSVRRQPEGPFALLVALTVGSAAVVGREMGSRFRVNLALFVGSGIRSALILYLLILAALTLGAMTAGAVRRLLVERQSILSPEAARVLVGDPIRKLIARHFRPQQMLRGVFVLLCVSAFMDSFVFFKQLIPTFNPFTWDASLSRWDAILHGGHQPWLYLRTILDTPRAVWLIDRAYLAWYPVVLMVVTWQAWSGKEPRRSRFFLAYGLIWTLGGIALATALSSAGPCFFEAVTGTPGPFAGLMTRLHTIDASLPLGAVHLQEYLWQGYTGQADHTIEGISALPSLHVAMAALIAILVNKHSSIVRVGGWAFVATILLGSVLLGWHYALDGYVAIGLVALTWWLAGRIQQAWAGKAEAR